METISCFIHQHLDIKCSAQNTLFYNTITSFELKEQHIFRACRVGCTSGSSLRGWSLLTHYLMWVDVFILATADHTSGYNFNSKHTRNGPCLPYNLYVILEFTAYLLELPVRAFISLPLQQYHERSAVTHRVCTHAQAYSVRKYRLQVHYICENFPEVAICSLYDGITCTTSVEDHLWIYTTSL